MTDVSEVVRTVLQYRYVQAKNIKTDVCEIQNFHMAHLYANALTIGLPHLANCVLWAKVEV